MVEISGNFYVREKFNFIYIVQSNSISLILKNCVSIINLIII